MDRRLAGTPDPIRFRIDATRCDGQGVCVLVAPELFALDRYGLGYVVPDAERLSADDADVRGRGLEADAMCPRDAIREEPVVPRPGRRVPQIAVPTEQFVPRLLVDGHGAEPLDRWRRLGGWGDHDAEALLALVEETGITGQGGAGFPTAAKWRRVAGKESPVVVLNGAEREPGTHKDRHLMRHRPALVLDGLRLAMRAVGASEGVVAVDEDAATEHDAMLATVEEAAGRGLLGEMKIDVRSVPTRYVAGEETALLGFLGGGEAIPRLRPPYPSDRGLWGRPTLVQNAETLAQVALAAAIGPESLGTGLFTVGRFGGPFTVVERPFGHRLRDLLTEAELLDGARAVLVGGYAGGLLTPDRFDISLTPAALAAAGASLGTKSIQVVQDDQCPVAVAAEVVEYFAGQTAGQCPPCSRGLPDMARFLSALEDGTAGPDAVAELETFMGTLSDRGVCRLPDGAARMTLSLLRGFPSTVERHLATGCTREAAWPR